MPKDLNIHMDFTSNVKELISGLEEAKQKAEALKQKNADTRMATGAQKAVLRTQAAAMQIPGVYGASGANQYSGYKPTGVGGSHMGAMGMGAVAGVAAAGVLMLGKVLKDSIKQSQILNKTFSTIGRVLGLLVDLVLLPFLPLLVWVMMTVVKGVLAFGVLWNTFWSSGAGKTLLDAFEKLITPIENLIKAIIDFFGGGNKNKLIPEGEQGAGLKRPFVSTQPPEPTPLMKTVEVISAINEVLKGFKGLAIEIGLFLFQAIGEAGVAILTYAKDLAVNIAQALGQGWLDFQAWVVAEIRKWATDAIKLVSEGWSAIVKLFTFEGLKSAFKGFLNILIFLVNSALNAVRMIPGAKYLLPENLPYLDTGGKILETGIAMVHKGETVVPAGQGGSVTMNFYGYQDDKFISKVKEVMRREGTRYSQ